TCKMPKERKDRSVSQDSSRTSPYPSSSSRVRRSTSKTPLESEENIKNGKKLGVQSAYLHNAVLLICSSHEKGCRPYMCNTSYRHSNYLDQFCKSFAEPSLPTIPLVEIHLIHSRTCKMPKERKDRSVSQDSSRTSPYPSSSSRVRRSTSKTPLESEENIKNGKKLGVQSAYLHNAVLLICSSHEKGCRPYMCNTSYRHSNYLDQFCKSFAEPSLPTIPLVESEISNSNSSHHQP
ncbi:hypothetical protein RYX36_007174, partial [Vicia faba]